MLHIAPEAGIARKIASANPQCEYVAGDIRPGKADRVVDVTRMSDFADASFDYIVMNHVLEHVQDEAAAIAEIQRCLRPGGTAVLSFPLTLTRPTYEDARIVTEAERLAPTASETIAACTATTRASALSAAASVCASSRPPTP